MSVGVNSIASRSQQVFRPPSAHSSTNISGSLMECGSASQWKMCVVHIDVKNDNLLAAERLSLRGRLISSGMISIPCLPPPLSPCPANLSPAL